MNSLTFDLETILDPAMPPYESRGEDTFPPPPYWQIFVVGLLWADDNLCTRKVGVLEGDERAMAYSLIRFVEERRPTLVTFNGRRFDLPVLTARCMRHGLSFPSRWARDVNYRFTDAGHFDVADALTDYGAGRMSALDGWAKCIGMPGKLDCKGSDVATMVAEGRLADVQAYCMSDVVQTHAVRLRFELARGMAREAYLVAMRSLLAAVDADARLRMVAEKMNRPRLLLEES